MDKNFGDAKPSLEELAHHGVKGMRWGVRKDHPTSADIHGARARQAAREKTFQTAKSKSARTRAATAHRLSEDRVTASRLTLGEKVTLSLVGGPAGLLVIGQNAAFRRSVERNVDKGRKAAGG